MAELTTATEIALADISGAEFMPLREDATGGLWKITLNRLKAWLTPLLVDDTAYDATTWDGVTDKAPSKNSVRDKIEALIVGGYTDEQAQDAVAAMLTAGTNIALVYNDAANTLTISASAGYTDEQAQDAIASLLVAGTNITLTYNDAANTLTIDATGGGSSGALTLISRQVLAATATTVTFSSIPNTYEDLVLVIEGRMTSTNDEPLVQFNSDSGANYDFRRANQFGTAAAVGATHIEAGSLGGSTDPASYPGQIIANICGYARTAFYKTFHSRGFNMSTSVASGNIVDASVAGFWRNTAAINRIDLTVASGSYAIGTVISLFGRS